MELSKVIPLEFLCDTQSSLLDIWIIHPIVVVNLTKTAKNQGCSLDADYLWQKLET